MMASIDLLTRPNCGTVARQFAALRACKAHRGQLRRHFREVSQWRSFELTHPGNRIGARMPPTISSTPKACGGGFSSSAPEARMPLLATMGS
jgi:hypothetical protein